MQLVLNVHVYIFVRHIGSDRYLDRATGKCCPHAGSSAALVLCTPSMSLRWSQHSRVIGNRLLLSCSANFAHVLHVRDAMHTTHVVRSSSITRLRNTLKHTPYGWVVRPWQGDRELTHIIRNMSTHDLILSMVCWSFRAWQVKAQEGCVKGVQPHLNPLRRWI